MHSNEKYARTHILKMFSPSFCHSYVRLDGYASAWHCRTASWDKFIVVSLGGITMTGGPVQNQKKSSKLQKGYRNRIAYTKNKQ